MVFTGQAMLFSNAVVCLRTELSIVKTHYPRLMEINLLFPTIYMMAHE